VLALVDGFGWLQPNRNRLRDLARAVRAPGLASRLSQKARTSEPLV
jgi:hypothetical protein